MTDPVRRDPLEFLRVLKKMSSQSSWQKSMIFASKGRMVGYRMTVDHYNTILYSQSIWGRALEIVRVVRAMNEDNVQMNGASYYYICNGMANADHGWNFDFKVNHRLERLQHWRVALDALRACEANGFDATDTMFNSTGISCVIPGFNRWREAAGVLHRIIEDERKLHPQFVKFLHDCLMRNMKPREATVLLKLAAQQNVAGYADSSVTSESDVFAASDERKRQRVAAARQVLLRAKAAAAAAASKKEGVSGGDDARRQLLDDAKLSLDEAKSLLSSSSQLEELDAIKNEALHNELVTMNAGLHATETNSIFRPRVYRQQWHKWHAIANKYRPTSALKKKQLAPRDSPAGIPAFFRL
ncbi:Hypothetical protein, putative [Bodo saltans]|uniref:Uncharacterized protein n=1 Tax=Bodo saltans TaxID=75058 RepID=A0A0S4J7D5_BODSA|nr:Hypothetical protein, putative [Bodo saltans]|eukprot:CUG87145.1 Hypothetical protein, putative [Bodo saltans]